MNKKFEELNKESQFTPTATFNGVSSASQMYGTDITDDYKLDKKNRLICGKCGHKKFTLLPYTYTLTVYPSITVSYYKCEKCGHKFSVSRKEAPNNSKPGMVYK